MDNQHRKISGYRELNATEIKLMNEVKALGPIIETVQLKIVAYIKEQGDEARRVLEAQGLDSESASEILERLKEATPERFAALAKTDFQTALMYLTRAVAQPTFF